ncbi:MAG: adenine deaminase [Oscillospiraceae bacterium]|nr:adenine deaminase [Oscillospiraceae bacterium]
MSEKEKTDILTAKKQRIIEIALGKKPAELVLKNASYVNVFSKKICKGDIAVAEGVFAGIGDYSGEKEIDLSGKIVLPGFIDAHLHLESSLASPAELAKALLPHGTTTVVCDPHEIANVMGTEGIRYILEATENLPIDVMVMIPSCVPATSLDESGAVLEYEDIAEFYKNQRVAGLAEMMNFPGVFAGEKSVLDKISGSEQSGKRTDGHAPGVLGKSLNAYVSAGIFSDHECTDFAEAVEKLERGQYIMIREGTAAKNLDALLPLLNFRYENRCMFCCDDRHPNDIIREGHIDNIVKKAVAAGVEPAVAVKAASFNAAEYFSLEKKGAVAPGYKADFIIADSIENLDIEAVYKNGVPVFENGKTVDFSLPEISPELDKKAHNTFNIDFIEKKDVEISGKRPVIGMISGQIVTEKQGEADKIDVENDILKIAVFERHKNTGHKAAGYLKGFGLKKGAVATSVSHDSHNIIAAGANDEDIVLAVNRIIENKGGIVVFADGKLLAELSLPIAGIMSDEPLEKIDSDLEKAKAAAYSLGANPGVDPFMTLSFMALPVVPSIRIMPGGIFDVDNWKFI